MLDWISGMGWRQHDRVGPLAKVTRKPGGNRVGE